jgi:hypothetical protein
VVENSDFHSMPQLCKNSATRKTASGGFRWQGKS